MGKYFRVLILTMAVFLMVAGTALAGTTRVNHGAANTSYTAALEAMGAVRNVGLTGAGVPVPANADNAALAFVLGQKLTAGNLLEVTLSGATFDGTQINICAWNGAASSVNTVATATPSSGTTTFNFQTSFAGDERVDVNNYVWFTNAACSNAAVVTMPVRLLATSSATNPTVRIRNLTAGGIEVDNSTAVTLATISAQFSVTTGSTTHTIDYLQAPGNGTRIINTGTTLRDWADSQENSATTNIVSIATVTRNLGAVNGSGTGASNAGLTVGAIVNLTDTASWQGVSRVYLTPTATACSATAAGNVALVASPTGVAALTLSAAAFNGTGAAASNAFNLCVAANTTSSLQTRVISSSTQITVSAGGVQPTASTTATAQTWSLNAYQALIPWLSTMATMPTYCLVSNNSSTAAASVILDVLSSENAVVISNQTPGTVPASSSRLLSFATDAASLAGGSTISLSTLGTDRRYTSRVTVTTTPANVTITCNQNDPAGGAKRLVPVLTTDGAGNAYKQ